jgi:arsenite-transporting ATPase
LRVLLFTGKGGVGKTTTAAATAVHAARCGVKTLVVSTDAAHSLGDVLGTELGAVPFEVEPGLFAQQVDARSRARRSWRGVQGYVVGVLDSLGVDRVEAEELTDMPGAEEVLALLEVRDQAEQGPWDLLVVDCAPTAETLRLLAVPEALARVVERLLPAERRVMRALAGGARPLLGARGASLPSRDHLVEAAERLHAELSAVRAVLTAPSTSVRLVLTPESAAVTEALRTWTTLSLYGYIVDGVVANRVFDADDADAWRRRWAGAQQRRLAEAMESFATVGVRAVAYADDEPVGCAALASIGEVLYGRAGAAAAADLLAVRATEPPLRVERAADHFVLVLDLPLARREELALARQGDELLVTLGSRRRSILLPSALRRCVVGGAALREGRLRVRFDPDPDLWRPL